MTGKQIVLVIVFVLLGVILLSSLIGAVWATLKLILMVIGAVTIVGWVVKALGSLDEDDDT